MPKRFAVIPILCLVLTTLFVVGCGGKQPVDTTPDVTPPPAPAVEAPPPAPEPKEVAPEPFPSQPVEAAPVVEPSIDELNRSGVLKTVYFDFDRDDLDDEDRNVLRGNAAWLRENSKYNVIIEGHCDERGTIEYNQALGERRARAVRDYLTSLGVPAGRMRIVTYGEERPADPGHNEAAWSKNRRGEFLIEG